MSSRTRIVLVKASDSARLQQVIRLADRRRRTLGFLPPPVFEEATHAGTLLAAVTNGQVIGYALYRLPRQDVSLTHLCVDDAWLGHGIARALVDEISTRHRDRRGIRLSCRRSYDLAGMWEKLGFVALGEREGRGNDRRALETWWKSHGLPDLFSDAVASTALAITVDYEIFAAMHGAGAVEDTEALALRADWLTDASEIVLTSQLLHDISKVKDAAVRRKLRAEVQQYHRPLLPAGEVDERLSRLMASAPSADPAHTPYRSIALRYAAEAAVGGAHVLVTRDDFLLQSADAVWEACGIQVLSPAKVMSNIDSLQDAQAYSPGLLGTSLSIEALTTWDTGALQPFGPLPDLSVDPARVTALKVSDADGRPMALYAWYVTDHALEVPVLRTVRHELESTLARQLIFTLRRHCRERGGNVVRIGDPQASPMIAEAAEADGFVGDDSALAAMVIDICGSGQQVAEVARTAAQHANLSLPNLPEQTAPRIAARVERILWPAKLVDSQLPSFLVPIKPGWADLLFGLGETLVPREDTLGISREHVYYRAPLPRGERAPARLLWYVSNGRPHFSQSIVASSHLEEVLIDEPDRLFAKFHHLGVYSRTQVRDLAAANGGRASAIRFSDTEVFPKRVSLGRLKQLAHAQGHKLQLASIFRISPQLFQAVYQEGHPHP